MKRFLLALSLAAPCCAQTVTTAPQTVTTTSPVVTAQTTSCTVRGGKCVITLPAQTLQPLTAIVPGQTVPVVSGPLTYTFTCKGPDMQHLTCSAVKQ